MQKLLVGKNKCPFICFLPRKKNRKGAARKNPVLPNRWEKAAQVMTLSKTVIYPPKHKAKLNNISPSTLSDMSLNKKRIPNTRALTIPINTANWIKSIQFIGYGISLNNAIIIKSKQLFNNKSTLNNLNIFYHLQLKSNTLYCTC